MAAFAAVRALWRKAHSEAVSDDRGVGTAYLTPRQVVYYMTQHAQWGERAEIRESGMALLRAAHESRERAAEGRIRTFGISPQSHEHEEIPKTLSMTFGLSELELLRDDEDDGGSTDMKDFHGGFYDKPGYFALRALEEDVHATWPRKA